MNVGELSAGERVRVFVRGADKLGKNFSKWPFLGERKACEGGGIKKMIGVSVH